MRKIGVAEEDAEDRLNWGGFVGAALIYNFDINGSGSKRKIELS